MFSYAVPLVSPVHAGAFSAFSDRTTPKDVSKQQAPLCLLNYFRSTSSAQLIAAIARENPIVVMLRTIT